MRVKFIFYLKRLLIIIRNKKEIKHHMHHSHEESSPNLASISNEFRRIDSLLFPLKSLENLFLVFQEENKLIHLDSLNIRSIRWRRSLR